MNKAFVTLLIFSFIVIPLVSVVPFGVGLLAVSYVLFRNSWVFVGALGAGFMMDILSIDHLGSSSMYLLVFLLFIFVYERKFEIQTREFVFLTALIGSIGYLLVVKGEIATLSGLLSALVAVSVFELLARTKSVATEEQL